MKKKYKCLNLDDYILPGYEEVTGNELFLINGGRVVKGNGTKESEYVPSSTKPKESETSSKTTASENSNSSKQNSTQSNPPSQKSDTEQETQQSKPTCTAAEIAAAKGAAANSYFESQDKKRQENKKEQKNTGTGSTSNSSYSQSEQTQYTTNDQYAMAQKDYDEHYGKTSSETTTSSSDSSDKFDDYNSEERNLYSKDKEMKISEEGINFIQSYEKFRGYIYDSHDEYNHKYQKGDSQETGDWTIGYGHKLTEDELKNGIFDNGIDETEGKSILVKDINWIEVGINKNFEGTFLTQNQFDALVSLGINIGRSGLVNSDFFSDAEKMKKIQMYC